MTRPANYCDVAAIIRAQFAVPPGAEGMLLSALACPLDRAGYCETAQLLRTLARRLSSDMSDIPPDLQRQERPL